MARTGTAGRIGRGVMLFAVVLSLAAAIRAVFLVQLSLSDLSELAPLDARFYRELAVQIADGGGLPVGALTFNPLYPVLLAGLFRLFGNHIVTVRILQSLIGLATVFLVYAAGRRIAGSGRRGELHGEAVGVTAAAITVFYPLFVVYEASLLATTLVVFLFTAAFVIAVSIDQDGRGVCPLTIASRRFRPAPASFVLGLIVGLGALGRPNLFLLLAPAMPVWLLVRRRRAALRTAVACIAGTILVLCFPILYNYSKTGRFVPVTTHGGINFYIGNRPEVGALYKPPDGMRWDMQGLIEDARIAAESETARRLTQAEVSAFWFGKALRIIRSDPGAWLRLLARKVQLFWNGTEVPDVVDTILYRDACPVLRLFFFPFAVISPLALLGLAVLCSRGRNRSIVLIFVIASLASILPFFVHARYRMPAVPLLIVLGALFIVWLAQQVSSRRWKPVCAAAVVFAVLLFASTRQIVVVNHSAFFNNLGNHYMQLGKESKALTAFTRAYQLDPGNTGAEINYARLLKLTGNVQEARRHYASALSRHSRFPMLAVEYGNLLEELGRREDAERMYRYAYSLEYTRDRVLACKLLSRLFYAEGNLDDAVLWLRRGLEIAPGDRSMLEMLQRIEGTSR